MPKQSECNCFGFKATLDGFVPRTERECVREFSIRISGKRIKQTYISYSGYLKTPNCGFEFK